MRLLILGMNYAPEVTGIAPYTAGIAEHLAARGHQVRVATTFPHYPQWRIHSPYKQRWQLVEQRNAVEVCRGPVYLPRGRGALQRMLYDTSLAASTLLMSLTAGRPDVIFCVSPPIQLGLTAILLARSLRVPFVLQVKDLPLDAALSVGMLRPGRALRVGRALERLVYGQANRIVVLSQGFRDKLLAQGVAAHRVVRIPDWVDTHQVRPMEQDPELRSMAGAGADDFLVVHAGNMGEKQGLASALAAMAERDGLPTRLALVGDGMDRPRLEAYVAARGLDRVRFLPLQPSDSFPRLLASADALLLNQRADVIDSVVPSKLLTYLASGRPVIAAVHHASEAAKELRAAGGGVVVPPEDPGALADAFRALASDPAGRRALALSGRRYVEEHYARESVLARFERFFSELEARPTRQASEVPS